MNSRHRVRFFAPSICAAALACAAAGATAQTLHKAVDADGRITYADRLGTAPLPRAAAGSASDVAVALASNSAIVSRRAAAIDRKEAALRLAKAQLQREQGAQPLPGEQTHASGSSTVNHRYWRRQEKLRNAVEQAQRRSNEIGRPQLAQR